MSDQDEDRGDVIDYTNEKTVAKGKKAHQKRRYSELEDLKDVLATPAGQRVIDRILDETKFLGDGLFSTNSAQTNHNLGKRDLGRWLYYEIMAAAPGSFISMMQSKLTKD